MNTNNKRKKITLILSALVLFIVIVHLIVFIFLNVSGKSLLKNYIKNNFGVPAQISSVSFRFPFTVVVKGFKCNDVEFSKADISLGLFNPFGRSVALSKVYINDLNFKLKIEKDKITIAPFFVKKTAKEAQPQALAEETKVAQKPPESKRKAISVKIGKLLVNNASAQILDLTKETPSVFNLKNIDIMLKHFVYPKLPKFYIEVNASLEKNNLKSDNLIKVKGWVDYSRRNMDVKFNINNADYLMFSEYYPPFWKPDNLGLKDAKLSLDSKINSVNNDLVIEAILALEKIEFLEQMQNDSRVNSLKTMIAFFRGDNGKPVLPIKLRTKMDSFHIDFASLQSEFKGKMKLDIGTIVINILDKAKGKIAETTKDVKEATVDKAVGETKEAAGAIKDVTVDKAVNTVKGVVGIINGIIKSQKEGSNEQQPMQASEQQMQAQEAPQQAIEQPPQAIEKPAQQEQPKQAEAQQAPPEGNIQTPAGQTGQNATSNQNAAENFPAGTSSQNQNILPGKQNQNTIQNTQLDAKSQNDAPIPQANTENQSQVQPAQ
ncbi:MAG: DUF748 domain-containing protein [Candidatus Omnitrophota bacterium]